LLSIGNFQWGKSASIGTAGKWFMVQ